MKFKIVVLCTALAVANAQNLAGYPNAFAQSSIGAQMPYSARYAFGGPVPVGYAGRHYGAQVVANTMGGPPPAYSARYAHAAAQAYANAAANIAANAAVHAAAVARSSHHSQLVGYPGNYGK